MTVVGFVGLGNMGSALAANLVAAGHELVTHDAAGSARSPQGARYVEDLLTLASTADVVVMSLPDGAVSRAVLQELLAAPARRFRHVVDTSTTGVEVAQGNAAASSSAGVGFIDAPVSGGPAGARARTLVVMYAGEVAACTAVEGVLEGLSDRRVHVGALPGLAQAVKLANNFIVATTLAAASEAVTFGTSVGVSMDTMLDVINASSGRSAVTEDKFVKEIATGRYASGFANTLMAKDVRLYVADATRQAAPTEVGAVAAALWDRFADQQPGADFTRIYPFVGGPGGSSASSDAR